METRSLQKTGGSSSTITLPKSWIVSNNLEKGGIVEIYTGNHSQLILKPAADKVNHKSVLSINYLTEAQIIREIIGIYVSGVEEIHISAKSIEHEQRSLIRNISYKLIGFELFDEYSDGMILKNVANSTISAREYVKKMFGIIRSMYDDIIQAINTSDRKIAKDIIERDVEIDRIHLTIKRQFNIMLDTMIGGKPDDLTISDLYYYTLAALRLERIADHIVRIAHTIIVLEKRQSIRLNKFELSDVKKVGIYIDILPKVLFDLDKISAHKILDAYDEIVKNEFINRTINEKPSINILIQDSLGRIRSYVSNIAEETIHYTNIKKY